MTPSEITPVTLMFEMRERLVRIETKMDSSAEKVEHVEGQIAGHDVRIAALESSSAELKTRLRMLAWLGGGLVTLVSLLGEHLFQLL